MRTIRVVGTAATTLALLVLTLTLLPQTANAAAVTKIRDHVHSIGCEVDDGTTRTQVAVARSDLAGTETAARISSNDGVTLAEGYGTSDWTDSTFRTSVELTDDDGRVLHTAALSGSYKPIGTTERTVNRFKDGNIRVVEDHSFTQLALSNVVLTVDGVALDGVDCSGDQTDGYLSFSNPSSTVTRGAFLAGADCVTDNMVGFELFDTVDALWVAFEFEDAPGWSSHSPVMNLLEAPYAGTFSLNNEEGPVGEVAATASLVRNGDVKRLSLDTGTSAVSERWVMTPYLLQVSADGPAGPVSATCTFYDVDMTLHVKLGHLEG